MIQKISGIKLYQINNQRFAVDIPSGINWNKPVNVLYAFKGKGGKKEKLDPYSAMQKLFSPYLLKHNLIIVYPEAPDTGEGWRLSGVESTVDTNNVYQIYTTIEKDLEITGNFYGFGISNGGCFVHLLNSKFPLFFLKMGVAAANLWEGFPLVPPTSIIHFHGQLDQSVPFTGGIVHGYKFLSTKQSMQKYVDVTEHNFASVKTIGDNTITSYTGTSGKDILKLIVNGKAAHNILSLSTPQCNYMDELFKFYYE